VLVVEDEAAIAELIAINLRHAGFEVTLAADADQARPWRSTAVLPDLVLLDWMLPGPSGPGAGPALACRRAHARAAGHHADRACRRVRQDHPAWTLAPTTT
jgi:DNA-binding response OmpR family regulator